LPGRADNDALAEREYQTHVVQQALRLMQSDFDETTWQACWQTKALGRPAAEVAAELGISASAVYAATHRVLRRLRAELQGFLDP
jgi:RNA polymerase sigma-70 factor (ECF subfamily)